jgi:hypothetical protein
MTYQPRSRRPRKFPEHFAIQQNSTTQFAFLALGRERAIAFLNEHHSPLDGRPIDIAGTSEGAALVQTEIRRMSGTLEELP